MHFVSFYPKWSLRTKIKRLIMDSISNNVIPMLQPTKECRNPKYQNGELVLKTIICDQYASAIFNNIIWLKCPNKLKHIFDSVLSDLRIGLENPSIIKKIITHEFFKIPANGANCWSRNNWCAEPEQKKNTLNSRKLNTYEMYDSNNYIHVVTHTFFVLFYNCDCW